MNTNDNTQALMPQATPPLPPSNQSASMPGAPRPTPRPNVSKKQIKDNMAAKIVAGVLGGVVVAGGGAAAIYAATRPDDDVDATPAGDNHVDHPTEDQPVHHHHHHHHHHVEPAPRPEPKDVEFEGLDVVPNGDGSYATVGTMRTGSDEWAFVDADMDGNFDVAMSDLNRNQVIEDNEIFDISDSNLTVGDFYRGLMVDHPEKAQEYVGQLEAVIDDQSAMLAAYDMPVDDDGNILTQFDDDDDDMFDGTSDSLANADDNIIDSDENDNLAMSQPTRTIDDNMIDSDQNDSLAMNQPATTIDDDMNYNEDSSRVVNIDEPLGGDVQTYSETPQEIPADSLNDEPAIEITQEADEELLAGVDNTPVETIDDNAGTTDIELAVNVDQPDEIEVTPVETVETADDAHFASNDIEPDVQEPSAPEIHEEASIPHDDLMASNEVDHGFDSDVAGGNDDLGGVDLGGDAIG